MIYNIILMRGDVFKVEATSEKDAWIKGLNLYPEIAAADISNILPETLEYSTREMRPS